MLAVTVVVVTANTIVPSPSILGMVTRASVPLGNGQELHPWSNFTATSVVPRLKQFDRDIAVVVVGSG